MNAQNTELSQADYEMVCAAQWNADPSVPVEDRFEEVYDDETNDCTGAARAIECAMSRDFSRYLSPSDLQADYDKHGNAWPFSGDHLGAQFEREQVYTPGVGVEPGDVIGRVRVHRAQGVLWA